MIAGVQSTIGAVDLFGRHELMRFPVYGDVTAEM